MVNSHQRNAREGGGRDMVDIASQFFNPQFMPHGHCYFWTPSILWLHVFADAAIAVAYYSIPLALLYFVTKRRDFAFKKIFLMFGIFILACGTTHVFSIWTIWHPEYGIEGILKAFTGVVSLATAAMLWPIISTALALKEPRVLEQLNKDLQKEIGDRKLAEEELKRSHAELEARVQERTQDLTALNAELREQMEEKVKAQEALKLQAAELTRSNADLEQFAYVASHDLREPLRMVGSFTQLLLSKIGPLDTQGGEYMRFITEGVRRMETLITDLLAYSRLSYEKREVQNVDTEKTLEVTLLNLNHSLQESGGTITHDPLPLVQAHPLRLIQLFQNLIGNALKFKGSEAPLIHVSASQDGENWRFSFKDNGIGINPKQHERIFEVFKRLHSASEYPGTGIGLALCKKIVTQHGGRIWVESSSGSGANFLFTLPVH